MTFLFLVLLGIVLALQFAVLFGPPYVPTFKKQRTAALELLDLKPGQTFYDLGCGDGSLLREAAERGLKAVGYEINPLWATIAWLRTRRYRKQVKIIVGNFWKADLSRADGVFVFLAGPYMKKLDNLVLTRNVKKPIRLVSHGFAIPGRSPVSKRGALFLYRYA